MPIYAAIYDGPPHNYTARWTRKRYIAIHNTSNDASAEAEASYATRRTDGISSHLYVDADSVIQSLDTRDKAGHAGSTNGNENAIAVEITGTNGKSREWWLANVAWDKLGAALAAIIRSHWPDGSFRVRRASVAEMKINPKVRAFYGHDDMRLAWGGTTHTDPGPNFPWDRLFAVTTAALGGDMAWDQGDENILTADTYRLYAVLSMQDKADYTIVVAGKPEQRSEPNLLKKALVAIATQSTANGKSLSELAAQVAELKTLVVVLAAKVDELSQAQGAAGTYPVTGTLTLGPVES